MKKQIISEYFQSWLDKNSKVIKDNFDDKAVYSECYGPIHRNKKDESLLISSSAFEFPNIADCGTIAIPLALGARHPNIRKTKFVSQ